MLCYFSDDDERKEDEEQEFKTRLGMKVLQWVLSNFHFVDNVNGSFIGQRIYKAVFKVKPPERNELFQPGRMVTINVLLF